MWLLNSGYKFKQDGQSSWMYYCLVVKVVSAGTRTTGAAIPARSKEMGSPTIIGAHIHRQHSTVGWLSLILMFSTATVSMRNYKKIPVLRLHKDNKRTTQQKVWCNRRSQSSSGKFLPVLSHSTKSWFLHAWNTGYALKLWNQITPRTTHF